MPVNSFLEGSEQWRSCWLPACEMVLGTCQPLCHELTAEVLSREDRWRACFSLSLSAEGGRKQQGAVGDACTWQTRCDLLWALWKVQWRGGSKEKGIPVTLHGQEHLGRRSRWSVG